MVTKRNCGLPLICLVCGDVARGINFDVMTCMSCKTFFRRHSQKFIKVDPVCKSNDNCEITKMTRGTCSACRLKKCYELGMNYHSLRRWPSSNRSHSITNGRSSALLPRPAPIGLLQNDRSNLTTDEWKLLSNIIHAYDETNIIPHINHLLAQQSSLPPKLRSKVSKSMNILKFFLSALQPFFECSPYFQKLSVNSRQILIQHNYDTASIMNCVFIIREMSALNNKTFLISCDAVYGDDIFQYSTHFVSRLEPNSMLIKILLLIVAFSTNCSIVTPNQSNRRTSVSNATTILEIQNIFVTMFWKYLIYQYGFTASVKRLNSLIKYILDLLHSINEKSNVQHGQMIDTIVEQTTRSLSI
ncbi:unnamed protein product [Adineta ricciae]|uniref:Nuclear receptor domain-containing protein n=1 Tax=Adineta ricciae TaxID=249248 RepID=A0A814WLT3_ADIRI|nr:unnamed protein product [Adineta ricciae]